MMMMMMMNYHRNQFIEKTIDHGSKQVRPPPPHPPPLHQLGQSLEILIPLGLVPTFPYN